jgi:hypothetical protein
MSDDMSGAQRAKVRERNAPIETICAGRYLLLWGMCKRIQKFTEQSKSVVAFLSSMRSLDMSANFLRRSLEEHSRRLKSNCREDVEAVG